MNTNWPSILGTIIVSTLPASAGWLEMGRMTVHDQGERFMRDIAMRAPVEKLRLKADGGSVFCRSVQANFANGATPEIFQGLLQPDQPTDVELPGDGMGLQSLTFQCGALVRGSAQIDISADVGRYRDQWTSHSKS